MGYFKDLSARLPATGPLVEDLRRAEDCSPYHPGINERASLLKRTTGYKQNAALKPLKMDLAAVETVLCRFNLADNLVMVLKKSGSDA